jgi:hypothetical protein
MAEALEKMAGADERLCNSVVPASPMSKSINVFLTLYVMGTPLQIFSAKLDGALSGDEGDCAEMLDGGCSSKDTSATVQ